MSDLQTIEYIQESAHQQLFRPTCGPHRRPHHPSFRTITVLKKRLAVPASGEFQRELNHGLPSRIRGRLVALDAVDSTNVYARDHREDIPDEAVIVADEQRAGRGRLDRSWYSERGASLLVTIVKTLPAAPQARTLVPLAVAVACATAIESVAQGLTVRLKWPNDLLIDDKKVGGILIGSVSPTRGAVGIGINVGGLVLPSDLIDRATSLSTELGRPVDRTALLRAIVDSVDDALAALHIDSRHGEATIPESFSTRMVGVGSVIAFRETARATAVSGVLEGLRADGALMIRTNDGIRCFHTGDLTTQLDPSL